MTSDATEVRRLSSMLDTRDKELEKEKDFLDVLNRLDTSLPLLYVGVVVRKQ